jgi:hypothetical protein
MNATVLSVRTFGASALAIVLLSACGETSDYREDPAAGLNGSFEVVQEGLPVNWYFYSPDTVPDGDFDIVLDSNGPRDGKQSLKFAVRDCSAEGGRYSPGFFQEFDAAPGETYTVSFWARNEGTTFSSGLRGVGSDTSESGGLVVERSESFSNWRYFEYRYEMPDQDNLRFEISVLAPGVLWVDDVRIARQGR